MLPQFELQAKRRLHHVKRRRQEQRRRVAIMVFSVTFLLGLLIFFNVYYIYRSHSSTGDSILDKAVNRVRRRGDAWVAKDAQPFVSWKWNTKPRVLYSFLSSVWPMELTLSFPAPAHTNVIYMHPAKESRPKRIQKPSFDNGSRA